MLGLATMWHMNTGQQHVGCVLLISNSVVLQHRTAVAHMALHWRMLRQGRRTSFIMKFSSSCG
jgi:hypothetical protein